MKKPYLLVLLCTLCEGSRILGLFPAISKSHFFIFESLMKELAERGHTVDVLSNFPQDNPHVRYNDLSIKGTLELHSGNFDFNEMIKLGQNMESMLTFMLEHRPASFCKAVLNSSVAHNLKNTATKYDLIITEVFVDDCMLGFAHIFKLPVIGITTSTDVPWGANRLIGNVDNPAYIPHYISGLGFRMTFWERFKNTLTLIRAKIKYINTRQSIQQSAQSFFGDDLPDLQILAKNISLIFVNTHFSVTYPRPTLPNFVEIGGIHIGKFRKLRPDINMFLDDLDGHKGVIYFSFGSIANTETLPDDVLKIIFDAFKNIPYKVLWKANRDKFSRNVTVPTNVAFFSWVQQVEVLCHPNVKLFIGHGGMLGSIEATYCGIPILGIPLFADQFTNLKILENKGVARGLDNWNIKEQFYDTLVEILENKSYLENARLISKFFRDREMKPLDKAIYWVEYVLRYRGASQLKFEGANLLWYQLYLYDVLLFSLFLILLTLVFLYAFIKQFSTLLIKLIKNTGYWFLQMEMLNKKKNV